MSQSLHHSAGFFEIARQPSVRQRALRIATVVGAVLALLNHGDRILTGSGDVTTWLKIALTFLVPYCVSTYSSVLAVRERLQALHPMKPS
ncbi:MAG: nitrate/nitrite transporter NrtS [Pseudomonadota bacterium]